MRLKQFGRIDNSNPRQQSEKLSGNAARTVAAQSNAWESLALYSASILVAHASEVAWSEITVASIVFLVSRLAHPVLYISDISTARSLVFSVGLLSCVYIVMQAF